VLNKIKASVAFDDLARKYSEDPGSKIKGGDLGWVGSKTGFVPEFKEALFKLNKGEVSPLVKSQFGYHIIKVDDTRSNVPKAINALQKALGSRANPQMAFQLGELLNKQKKSGEAVVAYQKAAEGAYDMPWLRPQLAQRFRDLKRPDLAAKEQAKWEQFQKSSKTGQTINVNGTKMELQHTQSDVSPAEL